MIRTVTSETVKQFYKKWYHLSNMAVVAVGDFDDPQVLVYLNLFVKKIKFEKKKKTLGIPQI